MGEIAPYLLYVLSRSRVNVYSGHHLPPVVFERFGCAHINFSFIKEEQGKAKNTACLTV